MAIVTTKSASITNWDANPIFIPTTGEGNEGPLRSVNDSAPIATTDSIGSTYRLVRIPTNAKVKKVWLSSLVATTAAGDIDVAFSDSTTDGTQQSLAGGIIQISAADNKLFGSAQSFAAQNPPVDKIFAGTFTPAFQNLPLWQVLVNLGATGFVSDPGGFFDIVLKTTAAATVAGTLNVEVDYVD